MSIHYTIEENNLQPGTFYARVIQGEAVHLEQMLPNIVAKTALSGTDVKGAISALIDEIIAALVAGNRPVIDGLVNFKVSLSGSFDNTEVSLTPDTARLNVIVQDDRALEAVVAAQASYSRVVTEVKAPIISSFFDVAGNVYDHYTAGSIIRLKGDNLKFDPAQADEGVFLDDGTTETRLTVYSAVGPKQIDGLLPPGLSGPLSVTVRTRYTEQGELRAGSHHRPVRPVGA